MTAEPAAEVDVMEALTGQRRIIYDLLNKDGRDVSVRTIHNKLFDEPDPRTSPAVIKAQRRLGPYIARLNDFLRKNKTGWRVKPGRARGHYRLVKAR